MSESEYKVISSMSKEELNDYGIKEVHITIDCNTSKRTIEPIYNEL